MPRRITRRLAVAPEFRDIDIMGVVHNCVYFEWFERGRLSIMNEVLSLDDARRLDIAVPVVKNSCEYFAPVRIGDRLELLTRHKIDDAFSGKLEFSHELRNAETGALHAYGECVCALANMRTMKLLREFAPEIMEKYRRLK